MPTEWKLAASSRTENPGVAGPELAALDDGALASAAAAGAREAFDVIVERHRRAVYRLCYRFAGNHEDASDLAQEVFIRAYRGLPRFKGESALGTWLHRIGVNVCLNRVGAAMPQAGVLDAERHVDGGAADPVDSMVAEERRGRVRAAIARLPRRQRSVLILRVYQELPHREIARVLGSSVGAVKTNFFHALVNLKRLLQEP